MLCSACFALLCSILFCILSFSFCFLSGLHSVQATRNVYPRDRFAWTGLRAGERSRPWGRDSGECISNLHTLCNNNGRNKTVEVGEETMGIYL